MSLESLKFRRKGKNASEQASRTENTKPSQLLLPPGEASGSELPALLQVPSLCKSGSICVFARSMEIATVVKSKQNALLQALQKE